MCAEHPDPSHGQHGWTVVRLATCARDVAAHELAELLLVGARQVVVRLDGCSDPAAAAERVEPVAAASVAGSLLGMLTAWLESTDPVPPEQVAEWIWNALARPRC